MRNMKNIKKGNMKNIEEVRRVRRDSSLELFSFSSLLLKEKRKGVKREEYIRI